MIFFVVGSIEFRLFLLLSFFFFQQLQGGSGMADDSQQYPLQPQQPLGGIGGGGGGLSSIRPGSMAERARLAKIPQPEAALKCPRCESTNTKFCYFNNYSLSQPRHFCKTCRRYWTRGGALRNVPVGGGCRRNRRSKGSSRSKSPAVMNENNKGSTSSSKSDNLITNMPPPQGQIPTLPTVSHFGSYNSGEILVNYASGAAAGAGGSVLPNGYVMEQWKMQQQEEGGQQQQQFFPFLINGGNVFEGEDQGVDDQPGGSGYIGQLRSKQLDSMNTGIPGRTDQLGSGGSSNFKMEENQGFIGNNNNLARNYLLGISGNYDQYMASSGTNGSNSWFPGFASSSSTTSHLL